MDAEMKLGAPTLRIRNLERTLAFYREASGLRVAKRYRDGEGLEVVELGFDFTTGSNDSLLVLRHDPNATVPHGDYAGLYHYAVLVPDRKSLASTFLALGNSKVSYEGFADHQVSESLYLHDFERNGIEIYADRPRSEWKDWRELSKAINATGDNSLLSPMAQPLDFGSLLGELNDEEREKPASFPRGARIGHVHLRVTNLERSVEFYHERLGLETMMYYAPMGAAFLSAGAYHHHIGLNTWHSLDGTPHREGEAGLDEFKMLVPENALDVLEREFAFSRNENGKLSIKDPDGIRITIEPLALGGETPDR